jgi:hypothetical protein
VCVAIAHDEVRTPFKSPEATAAVVRFQNEMRDLSRKQAKELTELTGRQRQEANELRGRLISELSKAKGVATKASDLDEAVKIRDAIEGMEKENDMGQSSRTMPQGLATVWYAGGYERTFRINGGKVTHESYRAPGGQTTAALISNIKVEPQRDGSFRITYPEPDMYGEGRI